ncbi:MAG: TatD family hydrolase [Chthoniobacter sp.]|nr:TatD family hydrolase [Chthoniobacter sp.]
MIDAHNHLHDARLLPHRPTIFAELARIGVTRAVVNGTREDDWSAVVALAHAHPWITPSFGLHPWHVATRSPDWLAHLREKLDAFPHAAIGEIGLDRWIAGHDPAAQHEVFTAQLALAAERDLPVTIHCLRAWGPLWDILRTHPLPARGFLLHAYGGPAEMVRGFAQRGAYFSFNAYFLHDRKAAQRAVFQHLPPERLLIETDAPDLRPPDDQNAHPLHDPTGTPLNHPANLALAYTALARLRSLPIPTLAQQIAQNFSAIFGSGS